MKLLSIFIFWISFAQASECDFLKTDPDVVKMKTFIDQNSDQSSYWPNYKIASNNYVFTKLSVGPACAILFVPGKDSLLIQTNSEIVYENKVFDFYFKQYPSPSGNPDFKSIFEKLDLELVYIQDLSGPQLVMPQVPDYFKMNVDNFNLTLMLHEGFHLFVQGSAKMLSKKWQEELYFDRDSIDLCYTEKQVASIFKSETDELMEVMKASEVKNFKKAQIHFKNYYAFRSERYAILKEVEFKGQYNSRNVTCKDAEIRYEFMEGMPEYFATMILSDLKISQYDERFKNLNLDYYFVGMVKMYALKTFLGAKFIDELSTMLTTEDDNFDMDALLYKTFEFSNL